MEEIKKPITENEETLIESERELYRKFAGSDGMFAPVDDIVRSLIKERNVPIDLSAVEKIMFVMINDTSVVLGITNGEALEFAYDDLGNHIVKKRVLEGGTSDGESGVTLKAGAYTVRGADAEIIWTMYKPNELCAIWEDAQKIAHKREKLHDTIRE